MKLFTFFGFGIILFLSLLLVFWLLNPEEIPKIFAYLDTILAAPPLWLKFPKMMGEFLLFPTIFASLTAFVITKLSPCPTIWSRRIVVVILLILLIRYLSWRTFSTLNLSTPLNGIFSLGLLAFELLILFNYSLQLFLMLSVKPRGQEANQASQAVLDKQYYPSVDILIPTYNEPAFILKRTVIGCQALNYDAKTIYLLDDTRRPEIAQLAAVLGCKYLNRPDNSYAKAGNLNQALPKTYGDLIAIFDADFVPTHNFLLRTVGFFQDKKVALVQTPQSFYNADPIARNLGLEDILTPEEEVFYRQLQPLKDAAGSVVCSGTSFVVRREALTEIGGFVTDSLSEDYFTGVRLSAQGYRLIYLDEKLSAGLAAENISAHATQRLRWARGTLQAFFINSNPLIIKGLNFRQRMAHLEGLLHWFSSWSNLVFLLMPLFYALLNIIPIRSSPGEIVYFFLPYYLTQLTVFSWLNYRSRSAILSGVYGLILAFPLAITVVQVLLNPFGKGFKVTPKGTQSDRFSFNWSLALPLLLLFILTAISLWTNLCTCILAEIHKSTQLALQYKGINLSWIWSLYNLIIIGAALLILLDAPKLGVHEWFQLRRIVRIRALGEPYSEVWGVTELISEIGTQIALTQLGLPQTPKLPIELFIPENNLKLQGNLTQIPGDDDFPKAQVTFTNLTILEERKLIELLYCRPGQWQSKQTPGELKSLWLLMQILLRPKFIFNPSPTLKGIKVAQI